MNINFLKPSHSKAKAIRRSLLVSTLFGLTLGGLLLQNNIKDQSYRSVEAATSDVKYMPLSEYFFHEGNPGWDDTISDVNTRNYFTAVNGPTGTGQNGVPGTVQFNGSSQYLATAKLSSNTNNPFQKNPNSSFTIAFDLEFTSVPNNWMFPITFYQGGDIYALTKGHAGFVVDNGDGDHTLMYLDKAADGTSGGWWGGAITKIKANTVYSIVVTINQSGNTKVYLNGSSNPVYNQTTNFKNYARSGSDWSVFSLGGIPWTKGSYELSDDHGGMGFAPCKFKYLQVYQGVEVPAGCAAQFKTRHYIPKAYTLTYDTNGGSSISSGTYYASTTDYTYTLSSSTTKTGFNFNGYSIKTQTSGANCTVSGTTLTVKANAYGNLAVRANWTATPVSFSPGSATVTYSTSSQTLSAFSAATCATGGGLYLFNNWW